MHAGLSARTIAAAGMALLAFLPWLAQAQDGDGRNRSRTVDAVASAACQSEARTRYGVEAVRVDRMHKAPKRTLDVRPNYPEVPPGTSRVVGQGLWVADILIDQRGSVSAVFVRREPKFTPPFPAFGAAIINAVRQWQFEPSASPLCMTVTTIIDWS